MGQAHCNVVNQSSRPICVITFNMAELAYKTYNTMYIIEPGGTEKVEANPDAIGLKVGIIYDTSREKQEMHFYRFICHNDSVLTVTAMGTEDIDYYGEGTNMIGKGKLRESSVEPFNMAAETCNMELATKKVNRAVEGMKLVVNKVKDTTEEAIKTVTGKEVNLDFIHIGPANLSNQPNEELSMHRDTSMNSLSSAATGQDSRFPMPNNSNNGNFNGPGNSRPGQTTAAVGAISVGLNSNMRHSPSAQDISSAMKTQQQQQEEERLAQEKWEAELERAKRQKRWELEIERIRRERAEREQLAELEKQRQAATAPVAGQGGCTCVIS